MKSTREKNLPLTREPQGPTAEFSAAITGQKTLGGQSESPKKRTVNQESRRSGGKIKTFPDAGQAPWAKASDPRW